MVQIFECAVIWQMMTIFFKWDINVGCSYFRWGERMFVFQCLMGGWWGEYSYRCQPVDYTNSPSANRVSAQNMQTNNEHETHLQYSTLLYSFPLNINVSVLKCNAALAGSFWCRRSSLVRCMNFRSLLLCGCGVSSSLTCRCSVDLAAFGWFYV